MKFGLQNLNVLDRLKCFFHTLYQIFFSKVVTIVSNRLGLKMNKFIFLSGKNEGERNHLRKDGKKKSKVDQKQDLLFCYDSYENGTDSKVQIEIENNETVLHNSCTF